MGIRGLLSYVLERREEVADTCDLVEEARCRGGIELLVDFYCFEHLLLNKFWKSLSGASGNQYLRILGGEYENLDAYVRKLVTDLQALHISLVMFIDGGKGSSRVVTARKLETWRHRHRQDVTKLKDVMAVCNGRKEMRDLPDESAVRPVLLEPQVYATLRDCGVEMHTCAGEADLAAARTLQQRPRAFAVLSNDSDFCVFHNCRFIPNDLFDLEDDLRLGAPQLPEKPLRLRCAVISSEKVVQSLGLRSREDLIELSILSGNDFSAPWLRGALRGRVGVQGRAQLRDLVTWVRRMRRVENHDAVAAEMQRDPEFSEAVYKSREFYNLTMCEEEEETGNVLTDIIRAGVQTGTLAANVLSMHNNFYWHRMMLEDCSPGFPCCEVALQELRRFLYQMTLQRRDDHVMEHGRAPRDELTTMKVYKTYEKGIPPANFIEPGKVFPNLRTFARVMGHLEPHHETRFFDRYGRKNGFTCHVLRYFLLLNWDANLHATRADAMVAIATLFHGDVPLPRYQSLNIAPTARCVTMFNWLQNVYRHAYLFLARLLHLSDEFPRPSELFSGAVWTGFYMLEHHQDELIGAGFPRDWAVNIRRDLDTVVKEKRHMIKHIVEGLFDFNPRF